MADFLARIGHEKNIKRYFFNKKKYTKDARQKFVSRARILVKEWEQDTKSSLSKGLPDSYKYIIRSGPSKGKIGFKRIQRPNNPFPHTNTGELRDSVYGSVEIEALRKVHSFKAVLHIAAEHGAATNEGYAKRKDGSSPSWVGWQDRQFGDISADVMNVTEVFDWMAEYRKNVVFK